MRSCGSKLHLLLLLSANERRPKSCDKNYNKVFSHHIAYDKNSVTIVRNNTLGQNIKGLDSNCIIILAIFNFNYLKCGLCLKTLFICVVGEMDLLRTPSGLRKKSSLLWNSLRLPRKHKGE